MVVAAVVVGIILHPIDQIHTAIRHVASGESVPLPEPRANDMTQLVAAVSTIQDKLSAAPASQAPQGPAAELVGVLNSLSEAIMVMDMTRKPVFVNAGLRSMAMADLPAGADQSSLETYRMVFHERTFVPDQLALIEDEMVKAPNKPRTDIVQLDRPRQFLKRYNAPLYNDQQEQTGFLISYTDITHEVTMDRLRQDFIANASHELRTPVTSVKVLLENLVEGAKDDPEVRDDFIHDAAREIDRMHDLVNDLLDIAALESGRDTLVLTTFNVGQLIYEALDTVGPQAKQRGVHIEPDLPEESVKLEGDATRVRQVLVNLITNAVKFTPAGGAVTVKAWPENGQVKLSIADTGIGIPAQDLTHIFDRFFRVTRGRSRLQGGSGLGLTIVKQAIDAHRGEITVESTEGQGTTFFISLPREQKDLD
jgi:two-component system phosphate regulon sensor histidine kinase PhoR